MALSREQLIQAAADIEYDRLREDGYFSHSMKQAVEELEDKDRRVIYDPDKV